MTRALYLVGFTNRIDLAMLAAIRSCALRRRAMHRPNHAFMTPLLNHSNFTIRQEAALLLGSLGPRGKGAISALKELLKQRRFQRKPDGSIDYRVQKAAEDALEKIDI